jgi:Mn-containing catalase
MPNFASPFSEPLNGRKLTTEELIRAIRFVIAAEYEAAQMYMQIIEATDNELAKKVLMSVTDEERVHAGEFLKVLYELAPDEAEHYKEGEKEVKKEIKKDETPEVAESVELSKDVCPICNEKSVSRCRCGNVVKHTTEDLEKGHGLRCPNGHIWSYQTADNKLLLGVDLNTCYDATPVSESVKNILRMIDEKTITAEDFEKFIAETSPTSLNKRVQRQMKHDKIGPQSSSFGRQIDDKTDHEPADHNDPTTTLRGKSALRKQIKRNKAHPEQFREAMEFLESNRCKPLTECQAKLVNITDPVALQRLTTVLARRPGMNKEWQDWLVGLDAVISKHYGKEING